MARGSIKELKSCYEHYRKEKKKQSKKAKDVSQDSDEPEWIEVLVEVLLSILSTESSVLRSVVQCVFRLLRDDLTPSCIGQLVSVLDPEGESNPLSQDSDSENEDSDSDDDDKDEENADQDGEGDADNSEDSELDEDEDEAKIPEQLKMAVQKALGTLGDSDNESIDADMITEEEGQKLDEALAEAFKQFQQGKGKAAKKSRQDKKALSDFRIRVLDLIDVYLDKETSMDACLAMIAPLLRCLEFCIQDNQLKELENRVRKTIKNLTKIRKFSSNDDVTVEILSDYLKSCIEKGERSHFMFQALGDVVTNFATFIVNCSLKLTPDQPKSPKKAKLASSPLTEILKENLQSYFINRNCQLPVIFFHSIFQIDWEGNFQLIPIVIDNIFNNSVRQFRRNEGLELICGFYKSVKRTKPISEIAIKKLPKLEKKFDSLLRETLKSDGSEFVAKNNYFSVLKKLLNIMKAFHTDTKLESSLEFDALIEIVSSYKGVISGKNKKKKQPQVNVNGGEKKTKKKNKKKRKNESLNGHPETNGKRKKKNSEGSAADSE